MSGGRGSLEVLVCLSNHTCQRLPHTGDLAADSESAEDHHAECAVEKTAAATDDTAADGNINADGEDGDIEIVCTVEGGEGQPIYTPLDDVSSQIRLLYISEASCRDASSCEKAAICCDLTSYLVTTILTLQFDRIPGASARIRSRFVWRAGHSTSCGDWHMPWND